MPILGGGHHFSRHQKCTLKINMISGCQISVFNYCTCALSKVGVSTPQSFHNKLYHFLILCTVPSTHTRYMDDHVIHAYIDVAPLSDLRCLHTRSTFTRSTPVRAILIVPTFHVVNCLLLVIVGDYILVWDNILTNAVKVLTHVSICHVTIRIANSVQISFWSSEIHTVLHKQ